MAWAKFDDGFADHPKNRALTDGAFRLHVSAILHCNRWLTDGLVTADVLPDLMRRYRKAYADELVHRGLWLELTPGELYQIHDFLEWNDSRARVEERREKQARKLREWREKNGKGDRS